MTEKFALSVFFFIFISLALNLHKTEGRYLPTRASGDRVDKLRELLKEVSKFKSHIRQV